MMASVRGHNAIVKLLVEAGADKETKDDVSHSYVLYFQTFAFMSWALHRLVSQMPSICTGVMNRTSDEEVMKSAEKKLHLT